MLAQVPRVSFGDFHQAEVGFWGFTVGAPMGYVVDMTGWVGGGSCSVGFQ